MFETFDESKDHKIETYQINSFFIMLYHDKIYI